MKRIVVILLIIMLMLTSCGGGNSPLPDGEGALGGSDEGFGEKLEDLGVYDGYFDGESEEIEIKCISGTDGAYTLEGGVLSFSGIGEDSVYSLSGKLSGSVTIDAGEYKFELELRGASIVSRTASPISVISADKFTLSAKKDMKSYIYDEREALAEGSDAAVFADCDVDIEGKGELTVVSKNNGGIYADDGLGIKNLMLTVTSSENAVKGKDGVSIESGTVTLISTLANGIKTTNSGLSSKGNQEGAVEILGGSVSVYSALDGIESAYDVVILGDAVLAVYTDKYSNYSDEVTDNGADDGLSYIRSFTDQYKYSVQFIDNSGKTLFVNAEYHSTVSGMRSNYYYYSYTAPEGYTKARYFIYSQDMEAGSDSDYLAATDFLTVNDAYDTFAISTRGQSLTYSFTSYSTTVSEGGFGGGHGGPGGFGGEGNTDKSDRSTKGIKAANSIRIEGGNITVKSYDDAIHANSDSTLENGSAPVGNITVSGGKLTLYSNDDGLHADGTLTVSGGEVTVEGSYEGAEGYAVEISGGSLSVIAKDDGVNSTATSGTGIKISGGKLYVYCTGDGLDSNSRSSYEGIVFSGGSSTVISNSGGNSAIDTESGYTYLGGIHVALMQRGGMSSEATHGKDFSSVGTSKTMSLSQGDVLSVSAADMSLEVEMPCNMSAIVVILGDNDPTVKIN